MSFGEKRRSVRVPVDFEASFTRGERTVAARVLNLSVDGVLLRTSEMLDSGDPIQLTFELVDQEVQVKGRVVWGGSVEDSGRTFGMGIHFENISAVQQAAIEQFIRNVLKI
ncbi:PilZ domain-containing protein [bacterium]|nr:PilZ domain-containing protein [bacterium]MCI0602759.1 PilZ domain-containing protein [bacterium]